MYWIYYPILIATTCLLCCPRNHSNKWSPCFVLRRSTVKWGESGLAGRVGAKFRPAKTETHLHEKTFWFSGAFRRGIENSRCPAKKSPVQSSLCFQGSKLCPNSPRQSRLPPLFGTILLCEMYLLFLALLFRYCSVMSYDRYSVETPVIKIIPVDASGRPGILKMTDPDCRFVAVLELPRSAPLTLKVEVSCRIFERPKIYLMTLSLC